MHRLEAELSTLTGSQKEVKMGLRASWAHCHSQAWASGILAPTRPARDPGRQLVGPEEMLPTGTTTTNYTSKLYIQVINHPLASREGDGAPLPASSTPSLRPCVTSCPQPFRIHLNAKGSMGPFGNLVKTLRTADT